MTATSRASGAPMLSADSADVLVSYGRIRRRRVVTLLLLALGIACAFVADLMTGPSGIGLADTVRGLLGTSGDDTVRIIVREVRLPSAVLALLSGAALGLAGAEMQTTLNNPLASPFTLGLSSWAVFGAALAIIAGVTIPGVPQDGVLPMSAFLFALLAVALLQLVARAHRGRIESLVLFGTALFFTGNAAVALMQFTAGEQALQQLVFWTMGSVGRATPQRLALVAGVVVLVAPFTFAAAWRMTALRLGEERAHAFGVDVERTRRWSLLRVALLSATAVAFTGTIPFIGLVGPHLARLLTGEDHRYFLPASALAGGLVMSAASVASKLIFPGVVLPIGIVTALVGVPFFVALLLTRRPGQ